MKNLIDFYLIKLLYSLSSKKRNLYTEASQAAQLKLLEKMFGIKICRRTLNYHLRHIEDRGEIRRIRRHKKGPTGKIIFHTSLTLLKQAAINLLRKSAAWFRKTAFNSWTIEGLDLDAPKSELQAVMMATYLKTTSG